MRCEAKAAVDDIEYQIFARTIRSVPPGARLIMMIRRERIRFSAVFTYFALYGERLGIPRAASHASG